MKDRARCEAAHPEGAHFCTLEPKHSGDHVAGDSGVTWPNGNEPEPDFRLKVRLVDIEYEGDVKQGAELAASLMVGLLYQRKEG